MDKFISSERPIEHPWLTSIAGDSKEAAALLGRSEDEQRAAGYFHTLREILQQPATWLATGALMAPMAKELESVIEGVRTLVLTGSGSSQYAAECIRLSLQNSLSIPVQTLGGGALLTHKGREIGPARPGLQLSLGRSGDSPESVGAISVILASEPEIRHLVVTCNAEGRLAKTYADNPRVKVILLAEQTNDCSLVMTSSFTNMVLAAAFLGMLSAPDTYINLVEDLSRKAEELLRTHIDTLAALARRNFARAIFLASGAGLGAARESALKMLEMTAGGVWSTSESYLGLRHGPMSAVHPDTLIVCFLSSDPLVRAYECDLIRELNEKQLGMAKLIFGDSIPADLAQPQDVVIECDGLRELGDENAPVLDVILGQLLAFFRCLDEGLKPDSPSAGGVISRVVQEFRLHGPEI